MPYWLILAKAEWGPFLGFLLKMLLIPGKTLLFSAQGRSGAKEAGGFPVSGRPPVFGLFSFPSLRSLAGPRRESAKLV